MQIIGLGKVKILDDNNNKFHMNSENIKLIKNIADKNPDFFFKLLSENYPFTIDMLKNFKDKLDWKLLSNNPNIQWSDELIETFEFKWDWDTLMNNKNAKISVAIIQKYEVLKHFGLSLIHIQMCIRDSDIVIGLFINRYEFGVFV